MTFLKMTCLALTFLSAAPSFAQSQISIEVTSCDNDSSDLIISARESVYRQIQAYKNIPYKNKLILSIGGGTQARSETKWLQKSSDQWQVCTKKFTDDQPVCKVGGYEITILSEITEELRTLRDQTFLNIVEKFLNTQSGLGALCQHAEIDIKNIKLIYSIYFDSIGQKVKTNSDIQNPNFEQIQLRLFAVGRDYTSMFGSVKGDYIGTTGIYVKNNSVNLNRIDWLKH
jgi:hypothetical protein